MNIDPSPGLPVAPLMRAMRVRARALDHEVRRLLASLTPMRAVRAAPAAPAMAPVVPAILPTLLRAEVEALPDAQRLVSSGSLQVVYARATQMPWCLQEIGRLRELTFRTVGEGTGKAADIDLYDAYYLHLFVWDADTAMIVGAYRLGLADEIGARYGRRGLYTQSLFAYGSKLLGRLNPAIELGRSFVREEYQRSYAPLMLLWRGIGRFILRAPQYAVLFGPVSISSRYADASRRLMVEFLSTNNVERNMARHVRPRRPFRGERRTDRDGIDVAGITSIEALSQAIERIERDHKGVPILLRQYLKLGGRLLGFSADRAFRDALDGLIMVDLRNSDPRVLARYMGDDGAAAFLAHHRDGPPALRQAS